MQMFVRFWCWFYQSIVSVQEEVGEVDTILVILIIIHLATKLADRRLG